MHLQRIKIADFKNLKNVEIAFSEFFERTDGGKPDQPIRSHAVIGQNGTGKSNLIEAIITIFRDVDLDNEASLDYELDYRIRGHETTLKASSATSTFLHCAGCRYAGQNGRFGARLAALPG